MNKTCSIVEVPMLTNEERAFLEAMAKAPPPEDINELRAMIDMIVSMMNQNTRSRK